jgi:N-acetylglutamate synthase
VRVEADLAALRDHAARSWPPAVARRADGWLLRSTPELDRGRLNSALPLRADPDLAPVLDFYAALGRPAQVQLAPIAGHPRLVRRLDAEGWGARWPTAVMRAPTAAAPRAEVELLGAPERHWLDAWAECEGRDDVGVHADSVLARLAGRAAYALHSHAVGIAVSEGSRAGLFCIAVAATHRRRGLGSAVVRALVGWAHSRGAREAYLEVERRNEPAVALYRSLGFTVAYDYVHRVAP